MKWILTFGILYWLAWSNAQVLSAYKKGSWWLVNSTSFTKLPDSYTHVGNFDDQFGTAEFIEYNNYGILDANGMVLLPARFNSIEALGSGIYYTMNDSTGSLYDISVKKTLIHHVQNIDKLNDNYAFIHYQDSLVALLHFASQKIHPFNDSCRIAGNFFNTLLTQKSDSIWTIYSTDGNRILLRDTDFTYNSRLIKFNELDGVTLITAKFNRKFSKIGLVSISGNLLSYRDDKRAYLYDVELNDVIQSGNYDRITKAYFGGYIVESFQKMGWMDEHGTVQIPIKYDAINKFGSNFIVRIGNLQGQYDSNYHLVIPVEFFSFYNQGGFLITSSILGNQGLYSLSANRMFLKNIHKRIELKEGIIKAYYGQNIRVIEFNGKHEIKQDFILPNAITVKQELFSPYDPEFEYDQRLLNLGWFYMKNENRDSLGVVIGNKYRWGLKNASDSILIEPKLVMPLYMANQPFSLIKTGRGKYKSIINTEEENVFFGMRNYSTGRAFGNELILEMDSLDCMNRSYIRYESTKGYRLLLPDNTVKKVDYVSSTYNQYLPYCVDGRRNFCEKSDVSVPISHFSLNGHEHSTMKTQNFTTRVIFDNQELLGGKWNFLDSNGLDLFPETFDFVQEFKHERAIVKRGNFWGVVNSDSIVIPCKYSEILRVKELNDTVFIVKVDHRGKLLLDSTFQVLQNNGPILKSKGDLSVSTAGKEQLIYRNDEVENTSVSSAVLLGYNSYAIRDKKMYRIINSTGKEVGETEYKVKELLSENLILVADRSYFGLVKDDGTVIVKPGKHEISRVGNFIYQTSKESTIVRNLNGDELIALDADYILYRDPFSKFITTERKGKIVRFTEHGNKLDKFKLDVNEPTILFSNVFFGKSSVQTKDTSILLGKGYVYELYDGGYFSINDFENHISVYLNSISTKVFEVNARRIREIGCGIFSYYSKEGIVILNKNTQKTIGLNAQIVSDFKDGFCLIQEGKEYYFLNEKFENPFNRKFIGAQPFQGEYASIKVRGGWTVIDVKGKQKSYPSFNAITQKGNKLFETNQKPTYGLYDNHGNMILPEIFEKIEFISGSIIKVYKTGEIGYYSITGKPIFELDSAKYPK